MKKVTSFTHLITGEGDRIAFTYSEMDEYGTITSQNNRKSFVIADMEIAGHATAIRDYIQKTFLEEK